jgi:hypothetical protein
VTHALRSRASSLEREAECIDRRAHNDAVPGSVQDDRRFTRGRE